PMVPVVRLMQRRRTSGRPHRTGAARTAGHGYGLIMTSWIDASGDTEFGTDTLPYGVFSTNDPDDPARVAVAVGKFVLDLAPVAAAECFDVAHVFAEPSLDAFLACGRRAWDAVRGWVRELVEQEIHRDLVEPHLIARSEVRMHQPFTVGDFVDFYS